MHRQFLSLSSDQSRYKRDSSCLDFLQDTTDDSARLEGEKILEERLSTFHLLTCRKETKDIISDSEHERLVIPVHQQPRTLLVSQPLPTLPSQPDSRRQQSERLLHLDEHSL